MARKKQGAGWSTASLDTKDLLLDPLNPRIDVPPSATQEQIRVALLEAEDVSTLAKEIAGSDGRMAGEKLIVIRQNGRFVVVEGNRRACACQMLLDRTLIPDGYGIQLPSSVGSATLQQISQLEADVAPAREDVEPVVTRRHTESGIKRWTPMANQRRIKRFLAAGRSLEDICRITRIKISTARRIVQSLAVMEAAGKLPCWKQQEKAKLSSPALEPTAYTRFFTLRGVKKAFQLAFDDKGGVTSTLGQTALDEILEFLARRYLLPPPGSDSNTRETPETVYEDIRQTRPALAQKMGLDGSTARSQRRSRPTLKADRFFENLICPIRDQHLVRVVAEISKIDHARLPTAATFLVRALIESSLKYAIQKINLRKDMLKEFHQTAANKGKEPGLDYIIDYCINHVNDIFATNVRRILEVWKKTKTGADLVIHGDWANASMQGLEHAASNVSPLVAKILDGTALK